MHASASAPDPALAALLGWLRECQRGIRELEDKAYRALYDHKDETAYRALMRERAEAIARLDENGAKLAAAVPGEPGEHAGAQLRTFAGGARNALRIGSIFYMSALLYPDEHKQGEPDNLERLISELSGG